MASIYESQGPQVQLGGPTVGGEFAPVRAYDPSQQMLEAVDRRARLQERDVQELTAFSSTLSKFVQQQGEEWKKRQIAKGFSAFLNKRGPQVTPQYQQEHKEAETRLKEAAQRDNQLANAAETIPGAEGVSAGIRNNSPALKGWEAYGYSIAQAQNAPFSLANYINDARNRNVKIFDPDNNTEITLSPRMGRAQAERALELLTEQWSIDTGISKINPQVLMEHAGNNIAITKIRLMEDWGKELDANAKAQQKDVAFKEGVSILGGITDTGTAQSASMSLEKALAAYGYQEINEEFPKMLSAAYNEKVAAGDQIGATALLTNLGGTKHPSGVGTYRERFLPTFQELEGKLRDFGADQEKVKKAEQLELFKQEVERYNALPVDQRDVAINDPTNGLLTRMRLAGMSEEDINEARTGGSTSFEIALLTGIRNGSMLVGANKITKSILDTYLANGTIDKSVYDQAVANPALAQQQTVNDVFKDAKDQAVNLIRAWQTKSFTGSIVPSEASKAQAKVVAEVAIAKAMSKYQGTIQAQVDANQPINLVKVSQDLAALARQELSDTNSSYYWNPDTHSAPNIEKATDKAPSLVPPTFTTTLPKNVLDAVTNRISSTATPVLDPNAVDIPAQMIADQQLAVNQGGKIADSIVRIATASGYKDVNRYLSDQATKNGMTWTPNADQQTFLRNAKAVSPSIAARLAGELTPSERRRLIQQLDTLRQQQQTKASLQVQSAPGGTFATFQNDLIQKEGGGTNPYGQYNFGIARTGPADPNLTNLKVRDVVRGDYTINGQRVIHFGAYQFNAKTFETVVKNAGIPMDAPFNKETQDRAFQAVVMNGALPNRSRLNDYMSGRVSDTAANRAAAIQDLQNEWTSMRKLTPAKLGSYLQNMRMERQQGGVDPNLIKLPAPQRTVRIGQMLLNMGAKIWQHPNFDINKGYIEQGGGRVGRRNYASKHHVASALDLPLQNNSVTQLDRVYDYLKNNAAALGVTELFWDRKGYYQNGKLIGGPRSNAIPGHDDHLHVAF
jgi:hypothetical protein